MISIVISHPWLTPSSEAETWRRQSPKFIRVFLIEFPRFTPHDVCFYLKSIPCSKATGPDGISVRMLQKTIFFTVEIRTDLLNWILTVHTQNHGK